jgi:CBS domain-containing protein
MKNSIAESIANFLSAYPPFSQMSFDELLTVALQIRVLNIEKNVTLFKINDVLHDCFYVVASGMINLSVISDAEETLLNKCREGDVLGLRPFFAKNNYMMTAKAREESVVYAIPIATFRPFVANNAEVLDFLLQSFASTAQGTGDKYKKGNLINDTVQYAENKSEIQFFQTLDYNKKPLLTTPISIVQNVAQQMTDNMTGCVIVHENNLPVGILTDSDLRIKIATGRFYITTLVSNVMSSPVITVAENLSLAEAQLFMLRYNVTHLCVTVDGSDKTEIKGVISQQDIIAAQANNPGVLIKESKQASNGEELKNLREKLEQFIGTSIDKKIPLSHIYTIAGEVNTAITKRAIDLAILEIGSPPCRFVWLNIGSQGRKEQLLTTDQDNILVFEDVATDKYRDVKDYFLKMANKVVAILETVGYKSCPYGHIANNPLWCASLSDWNKNYNNWINTPGEKTDAICGIFFDYEFVYGEIQLEELLTKNIFENIKNKKKFFAYLGTESVKKPPAISFFKQFNVEEEGKFKNLFDIKNRGLIPYTDAARLLVLSNNIKGINNTFLRFKQLAIAESKYSEVYNNAAEAFLLLSKFRTLEGLKNGSEGQYINLEEISKSDKEKLKNAFFPLKDLEDIIKNKFSLTYFS